MLLVMFHFDASFFEVFDAVIVADSLTFDTSNPKVLFRLLQQDYVPVARHHRYERNHEFMFRSNP